MPLPDTVLLIERKTIPDIEIDEMLFLAKIDEGSDDGDEGFFNL